MNCDFPVKIEIITKKAVLCIFRPLVPGSFFLSCAETCHFCSCTGWLDWKFTLYKWLTVGLVPSCPSQGKQGTCEPRDGGTGGRWKTHSVLGVQSWADALKILLAFTDSFPKPLGIHFCCRGRYTLDGSWEYLQYFFQEMLWFCRVRKDTVVHWDLCPTCSRVGAWADEQRSSSRCVSARTLRGYLFLSST